MISLKKLVFLGHALVVVNYSRNRKAAKSSRYPDNHKSSMAIRNEKEKKTVNLICCSL